MKTKYFKDIYEFFFWVSSSALHGGVRLYTIGNEDGKYWVNYIEENNANQFKQEIKLPSEDDIYNSGMKNERVETGEEMDGYELGAKWAKEEFKKLNNIK